MAFGTTIAASVTGLIAWLQKSTTLFSQIDPNQGTFFVDSLTFVVSAFLIYRIRGFRRLSEEERIKMSTAQVKEDFKEGLRYLWDQRLTRVVLLLTLSCFLGGGTIYVLTIGFVNYVLGKSDSTFMYILSVLLFGIMFGSILGGVLRNRVKKERVMGVAISGFGAGVVAFSLVSVVWVSFIIAFCGGICMGYAIVGMVTLLMETLDEEYRGRAFAAIQVIMRASIFLSIMLAGPLADLITGLGRRLGFDAISLGVIRFGGSYVGEIDGTSADFTYLINGPQIILFLGGVVILLAGIYGHRSFRHHFGWTIHDKVFQRRPEAGETAWEPAVEGASAGAAGTAEAAEGEMTCMAEAGALMEDEPAGEAVDHAGLREEVEAVGEGEGEDIPDGDGDGSR
jgi:hypothetical protein